jgi:SAM-dependent methyltransferase
VPHEPFDERVVGGHFDRLAESYDAAKRKNWYYYAALKKCLVEVVPPGADVLEIGTATGELLAHLAPARGVGIDVAPRMIEIASRKFPGLEFHCASYRDFRPGRPFDYVVVADVIEHLPDPGGLFEALGRFSRPGTRVVLTMANPAWEPLLELGEKLRLKMAEGPHARLSERDVVRLGETHGFECLSRDRRLPFPLYVPGLSEMLNDRLGRSGPLAAMGVIVRMVFRPGKRE